MTYDKFLEETNLLNSKYESDRQELADKYSSDIEKLSEKKNKATEKLFEEYKKYQSTLDKAMLDGVIDAKEKKALDKLNKAVKNINEQ